MKDKELETTPYADIGKIVQEAWDGYDVGASIEAEKLLGKPKSYTTSENLKFILVSSVGVPAGYAGIYLLGRKLGLEHSTIILLTAGLTLTLPAFKRFIR